LSLRKSLKRIGRKSAKTLVKVNRGITVGAAAVGTYLGGPVVGAAVTAAGAVNGQYLRATQARNEGVTGRQARALGRGERKRVATYGAAAMGVGMATAVTVGALGYAGSGAAGNALAGTTGSSALFGSQTATASLTAAQLAANAPTQFTVPGVGQFTLPMSQAAATANATGGAFVGTQALAPVGAGAGLTAGEILGATNTAYEAYKKLLPGQPAPVPPTGGKRGGGGGGGGGGDQSGGGGRVGDVNGDKGGSDSILPLVLIGAVVLMAA
jgi:hypothetical protein